MKNIQENQFIVSQSIEKIPLSQKVTFPDLIEYLQNWLNNFPNSFRLDGNDKIGPANPSQVIYFEISDFREMDFEGNELGKAVTGKEWNGVYFLTAGCRRSAVKAVVDLYKANNGDASKIFILGYTKGQEGKPRKRKLLLRVDDDNNSGWTCKQYIR